MFLTLCFNACKNKKIIEAEKIVDEWVGKTIKFPENLKCCVLGEDTISDICIDLYKKEYKILLYVDSAGCTTCRLRLSEWKQFIQEVDTLFHGQVGFILFFQPKNLLEMRFLFKQADFKYPVIIDTDKTIDRLNHLPKKDLYKGTPKNSHLKKVGIKLCTSNNYY
jgi:hypothetical protein